jgi:hypothetical protein
MGYEDGVANWAYAVEIRSEASVAGGGFLHFLSTLYPLLAMTRILTKSQIIVFSRRHDLGVELGLM